jgi:low affinity Fe/Cu permease
VSAWKRIISAVTCWGAVLVWGIAVRHLPGGAGGVGRDGTYEPQGRTSSATVSAWKRIISAVTCWGAVLVWGIAVRHLPGGAGGVGRDGTYEPQGPHVVGHDDEPPRPCGRILGRRSRFPPCRVVKGSAVDDPSN